jgi:hypothetical protein
MAILHEIGRLRDRPLPPGLDVIGIIVIDWSGSHLADDVSLLAIERTE